MQRRQDIALGAVFMTLGLLAAWMAGDWRGASGTYPMVLGLVLAACGLGVAGRALRLPDIPRQLVEAPRAFAIALAGAIAYVALVVPLGFYTASALVMLALPVALGFRRAVYALVVAGVFVALVWVVFSVLLEKPLPTEWLLTVGG
ncbi:tripartite tricarboxylate transporter TctB family protein [Tropicibacter sp. S64]|uniref:tripartite tricarboxylate transporter TctB family protein n=1 Tax=Tropicibacter sp. S64 TaxID=3415122 RepID=UPI003C7CDE22